MRPRSLDARRLGIGLGARTDLQPVADEIAELVRFRFGG
jgi:hypothetical protein